MRIAVFGTGAVGGYFGAKLAVSGQDVGFIARGENLQALRRHGLQVKSPDGDLHVMKSLFTSDPAAIGAVDLVLFCVKSYDTDACLNTIAPLISAQTATLSLQNGVDNPDRLAAVWGSSRTIAGVVYLGAKMAHPGTIEHSAAGRIVLGPIDGTLSQTTRDVQQVLAAAAIPCEVSTSIRAVQWEKLLWNAAFCAISCLTRATVKDIVESDALTKLAIDCMSEVREAANSYGVELAPERIEHTLAFSKSLGDFKPSMLQDLEAGKPLEYEAFNGFVVNRLSGAGRTAPINQVFYRALKYLDQKIRERRARNS
jgi:2-dehydropantoate 2-reductase